MYANIHIYIYDVRNRKRGLSETEDHALDLGGSFAMLLQNFTTSTNGQLALEDAKEDEEEEADAGSEEDDEEDEEEDEEEED